MKAVKYDRETEFSVTFDIFFNDAKFNNYYNLFMFNGFYRIYRILLVTRIPGKKNNDSRYSLKSLNYNELEDAFIELIVV